MTKQTNSEAHFFIQQNRKHDNIFGKTKYSILPFSIFSLKYIYQRVKNNYIIRVQHPQ